MSGLGTKARATPGRPGGPFFPQRPTGEKKTLQRVLHSGYPRLRRPRVLPWLKWVRDKEKWRCESCRAEGLGSGVPKQGQLVPLGRATQQKAKKSGLTPLFVLPGPAGAPPTRRLRAPNSPKVCGQRPKWPGFLPSAMHQPVPGNVPFKYLCWAPSTLL